MLRAPVKRAWEAVAAGWRVVAASALLLLMALAPLPLAIDEAEAQQRVQHRSIMEMLFGPRRQAPPQQRVLPRRQAPPQAAPRRSAPANRGGGSRPAAAPPPQPTVEKEADATKVLVVGDFMASGLADGLEQAFAESSDVIVLEETNGSSGLVRDDFYDWQAELPGILERTDPDIVAVMLGSNDRQQLRVDGAAVDVRSEPWNAEYARRVDALAAVVAERELPLIWVGAPAFESSRMSADILAINEIFRDRVTEAKGTFVDIWDGFVDENGAFIFTGSDVQGQQVRLRGSDGINMTAAGKRKMAFYAERPIRRILEEMNGASPEALAALSGSGAQTDAAKPRAVPKLVTRTPPMLINDPAFDGGKTLLGAAQPAPRELRSPRDRLVEDGIASAAPYGRADHFKWSPEKPEEDGGDPESDAETFSSADQPAGTAPDTAEDSSAAITAIIRNADRAL